MTGACCDCRYFGAAGAAIERLLPGVAALSSGQAASRAGDGLCLLRQRHVRAAAGCDLFQPARPGRPTGLPRVERSSPPPAEPARR